MWGGGVRFLETRCGWVGDVFNIVVYINIGSRCTGSLRLRSSTLLNLMTAWPSEARKQEMRVCVGGGGGEQWLREHIYF